MAKYKIATPAGASFTVAGGGYDLEMEPLAGMDAQIVEGPVDEDGFIRFCQDADAMYAKGIRITKKIIDGLPERCRAIVLGSVGVDS
ncbi:MAG TPA: C-terminal binding protein, partial [Acetobacteraceae bacterium]